ncbi:hypothetical protein F5B20DRAFT_530939 [Whalleya microplaca]|nr:hypothetical protein F5B20DRAFT_530939 [Whalleya microplaca]
MGLAGTRNRRKLDYDPNNTRWTRDETTFGQKILRAHGWEPGKFLGAQNSAHSDLHTAASSAPIKVTLKDDTLGLGAKPRQKQNAECTGLDGFKDLLGRLNGKSEEAIEKERKVRLEVKTSLYVERRFGPMRFVSGGLLVGDQMQEPNSENTATSTAAVKEEESESKSEDVDHIPAKRQKKEKKSKKRNAEDTPTTDGSDIVPETKRKKRSKDDSKDDSTVDLEAKESSKKKKKSKKSKREDAEEGEPTETKKKSKKSKDKSKKDVEFTANSDKTPVSLEDTKSEKSKRKREKKEKKEKKRKQWDASELPAEKIIPIATSIPALDATPQESGSSTPVGTGTSTPQALTRHYVRSRNIASKRMAMADIQALNQIFMVKPV